MTSKLLLGPVQEGYEPLRVDLPGMLKDLALSPDGKLLAGGQVGLPS